MGEEPERVALRISKPFGKRLVERAEISEGAIVLDIGTGLGPVFFPAVGKVGQHGFVVGVDIADEMVRGTYDKINLYTICNATVIQADARRLTFKDNTFDAVLSGFSYLDCSPKEVIRVLKERGQLALSSWALLEDMEYMAECVNQYLPVNRQDVYHQSTPEELRNLLCEAGFENITVVRENQEFVYKDEEEWWEEMLDSGWQHYVEKIKNVAGDAEEFKKEAFEGLQVYRRADGISFTLSVLFAFCTKSRPR